MRYFDAVDIPLDIQEKAKEVMTEKIKEDREMKNYIFYEGEHIGNVVDVAGIALRDAVFQYKNIVIKKPDTKEKTEPAYVWDGEGRV